MKAMNTGRKTPIRTCVGCRESSEKKKLTRIVRCSDGEIRIDLSGKMPGRGAYLCGAKECTAQALKSNKLGRALRCEIPDRVKQELATLKMRDDYETQRDNDGDMIMESE